MQKRTILLSGATGYVGKLLLPELTKKYTQVKCMSRNPKTFANSLPANASAVFGDTGNPKSLKKAMKGVTDAYYLVHSLGESDNFEELESNSAKIFGTEALQAGVQRIIFLGALSQDNQIETSAHMSSRHKVGQILRESGVPTIEFRASVIIGVGSMPFEAVRALVERLPVMVTPRWVRQELQPISARDIKNYLIAGLDIEAKNSIIEIGGSDVVRYQDLMKTYGQVRGLKRAMVPVPVITPRLSSHWLKLITPAHYKIGRRIVESAVHRSVVVDNTASIFNIKPIGVTQSIKETLIDEESSFSFLDTQPNDQTQKGLVGTRFVEKRIKQVNAEPDTAFKIATQIGGKYGWFWLTWLWAFRGFIDRIFGGVGMRKGRPEILKEGDQLDFWTVIRVSNNRLTLGADMRLPGEAAFDIQVQKAPNGGSLLIHTVSFNPKGWFGHLYWFVLYPIHALVFNNMVKKMARKINSSAPLSKTVQQK